MRCGATAKEKGKDEPIFAHGETKPALGPRHLAVKGKEFQNTFYIVTGSVGQYQVRWLFQANEARAQSAANERQPTESGSTFSDSPRDRQALAEYTKNFFYSLYVGDVGEPAVCVNSAGRPDEKGLEMSEPTLLSPTATASPDSKSHASPGPGEGRARWAQAPPAQQDEAGGIRRPPNASGPSETIPSVISGSYALLRDGLCRLAARQESEPPQRSRSDSALPVIGLPHVPLPWASAHAPPIYSRPTAYPEQEPSWQYRPTAPSGHHLPAFYPVPQAYDAPWIGYHPTMSALQPVTQTYPYPTYLLGSALAPPRPPALVPTAPSWHFAHQPSVPFPYGPQSHWMMPNGYYFDPGVAPFIVAPPPGIAEAVEPVARPKETKPPIARRTAPPPGRPISSPELEEESDDEKFKSKTYTCGYAGCGKTFSSSGNLRRHRTLHLEIARYECPIAKCAMRFTQPNVMVEHYRCHLKRINRTARREAREGAKGESLSSFEGVEMEDDTKITESTDASNLAEPVDYSDVAHSSPDMDATAATEVVEAVDQKRDAEPGIMAAPGLLNFEEKADKLVPAELSVREMDRSSFAEAVERPAKTAPSRVTMSIMSLAEAALYLSEAEYDSKGAAEAAKVEEKR